MKKIIYVWLLGMLLGQVAFAAGPKKVAFLDRDLWPLQIDSAKAFDQASQAEILSFVHVIANQKLTSEAQIKLFTSIKNIDLNSVSEWKKQLKQQLVNNLRLACDCQVDNWQTAAQMAIQQHQKYSQPQSPYHAWYLASQSFYQRYFYEQARLAALFPRISSEIATFSTNEVTGNDQLKDRQFLLSYDDGPSKKRTQKLIKMLESNNIHALFFVLGQQLEKVNPAKNSYASQCLASHGYQHKSHQKWSQWQDSLDKTRAVLQTYQQGPFWFRPPYGQRTPQLTQYLADQKEAVMLWNIDSQDWNRKLSNQQVEDRVISLMLLWRKGIILYHDIHAKAQANLPGLIQLQKNADLHWVDCRSVQP